MRINRGHWKRVAVILIGWAGTLGIGGLVGAEPFIGAAVAPATSSGLYAAAGSADSPSPAVDFNEFADTRYRAAPDNSAREPLLMDPQWITSDLGRPQGALARTDTQAPAPWASIAQTEHASELANWAQEFNSTVKDAVRPLFEELAGSSFVATVRDLESELGLSRRWSFNDPTAGDYSQNTGRSADAEAVSWQRGGDRADPDSRARSPTQIEADRATARIRIERYIGEIKSWLLSLVGLLVVVFLAKLGLDYRRWKAARRRRHGTKGLMGVKGVRRRRRKRRAPVSAA